MPIVANPALIAGGLTEEKVLPAYGNLNTKFAQGVITEAVSIADENSIKTLASTLPPRSRITWCELKYVGAATIVFGTAAAYSSATDSFALCGADPGTGGVTVSTAILLIGNTTLTQNKKAHGPPPSATIATFCNTTTATAKSLYIIPCDSGGAKYFGRHTTPTSGNYVSGATTVHVSIHYERYGVLDDV